MVRFASRLVGNVEIAEEIVQDSFLELYGRLLEGGEVRHHRAWVMRVVRRKVWRVFHIDPDEQLTHETLDFLGESECVDMPQPDHAELSGLLAALTPREMDVVLLRAAGLSYTEIASQLQISTGAVGTLLARSLRKMQAVARAKSEDTGRNTDRKERNVEPLQ